MLKISLKYKYTYLTRCVIAQSDLKRLTRSTALLHYSTPKKSTFIVRSTPKGVLLIMLRITCLELTRAVNRLVISDDVKSGDCHGTTGKIFRQFVISQKISRF